MRNLYFLLFGGLIFLSLSCSQPQDELLIDSFEGKLNHETVDFGASIGSSLKVEAEKELKVCGKQSMKLDYVLDRDGYMWVARGYNVDVKGAGRWLVKPQKIHWEEFGAFSIYMYGSNSGGVVNFDVKDAGGEMWRFVIKDDFEGWKEVIFPFSSFFVRKDWQPQTAKRNEILDFPVMSFQFEPRLTSKGVYYFDCVKLLKAKEKTE